MQRMQLHLRLESDATFGRGEGVAGLVDEEIEYDAATGLPFVRGRSLKGLLVEECANLLFALQQAKSPELDRLKAAAERLFGRPGGTLEGIAQMHIGPALLPQQLREAVGVAIEEKQLEPSDVLESLTSIRRQTAVDEQHGSPEEGSLRSMRVVLRQTSFWAGLDFAVPPEKDDLALLAACVLSSRRAGVGRNRGRGRVRLRLLDEQGSDITMSFFEHFQHLLRGGQA